MYEYSSFIMNIIANSLIGLIDKNPTIILVSLISYFTQTLPDSDIIFAIVRYF